MKIPTPILGVFIALIAGMLMLSINTASSEVRSIIIGAVLMLAVGTVGVYYRIKASRHERNPLPHLHHRKLIRRTS